VLEAKSRSALFAIVSSNIIFLQWREISFPVGKEDSLANKSILFNMKGSEKCRKIVPTMLFNIINDEIMLLTDFNT
jgi:hypothetical protein